MAYGQRQLTRTYLKIPTFIIGPLVVIPAQAGNQYFRAFLDARFRGHDNILKKNRF
jgi:hypothetical protein